MHQHYEACWPSGVRLVFRGITLAEHRLLCARPPSPVVACDVYELAVVSGPNLRDVPAGCVSWLGDLLLSNSPFAGGHKQIAAALQEYRQQNQGYIEQAQALIAGAFHYRFEDMQEWDADLFFDRLVKAELFTGRTLNPASPSSPDAGTPAEPKSPEVSAIEQRRRMLKAQRDEHARRVKDRRNRSM